MELESNQIYTHCKNTHDVIYAATAAAAATDAAIDLGA